MDKKYLLVLLLVLILFINSCIKIIQSPTKDQESTSEKCELQAGIACQEFKVTPTDIILKIRNALGYDIKISEIKVGSCESKINAGLNSFDE